MYNVENNPAQAFPPQTNLAAAEAQRDPQNAQLNNQAQQQPQKPDVVVNAEQPVEQPGEQPVAVEEARGVDEQAESQPDQLVDDAAEEGANAANQNMEIIEEEEDEEEGDEGII